jgi:acetyl-CoA carboxylase alpha subunit
MIDDDVEAYKFINKCIEELICCCHEDLEKANKRVRKRIKKCLEKHCKSRVREEFWNSVINRFFQISLHDPV